MGNLGGYETITTLAKSVGGVENLIKKIEVGAVSKAAPKLVAVGVLAGAALMAGGAAVVDRVRTYQARQRAADEAKDQLRAQAAAASDDTQRSSDLDSNESDDVSDL